MYDAFSAYARLMASGYLVFETGLRVVETINASRQVISERAGIVGEALRSPLSGDHVELSRMIPEKAEVFLKAGAVIKIRGSREADVNGSRIARAAVRKPSKVALLQS
jgi:hypothetical protein